MIANDPAADPRSAGLPPGHPPLRCFLGVPVHHGGEVVGLVGIANRPGGYTGTEQHKIEIICRSLGVLYESDLRSAREAELESERLRLEVRLNQSHKMEALGQLAGGIAHDFNNLLTAILGNVEMLQDWLGSTRCPPPDERVHQAVAEVGRAGERAAALTRQLLVFGRRQVPELELVDVGDVVRDLVRLLERLIGEHIRLDVQLEGGLAPVYVDRGQLEQVLMNLTINARDAMPNGGTLEIRTGAGDAGSEPGGTVALSVRDSGVGMDTRTRERLFEPFFTTKPVGQGTGLGLATVYGIVSQAGGRILVDSALGHGSTFEVLLPAAESETGAKRNPGPERRPAEPEAEDGRAAGATILVCEDEASVRDLICTILRRAGYQVLEAADPRRALELVEGRPEALDLLITDVVMPEINGKLLADRLQGLRSDLKVLFVSGYTQDFIAPQGIESDSLELLHKPFTIADLTARVRRLLGE